MLSPAPRLLWIIFVIVVPVFTLAGLKAEALLVAGGVFLVLMLVVAFDAWQLIKAVGRIKVSAEPPASASPVLAYKDRPGVLKVKVDLPDALEHVHVALEVPASFHQEQHRETAISSSTLIFAFTPDSRGEFEIRKAFLSAPSAWKLWRMQSEKTVSAVVKVFPDLSKDPSSRRLFSTLQQGQRVQRLIGRGREVERLREYAPGDSFDEVYWKGTAKRGFPVSKVFQVERTQDIYAMVDGSRLGNRNQALERFVSAALMLAVAAEKNNDNFGLLTFRDHVEHFVRAAHGKGHFQRCREAIFDLQPTAVSPDFVELFTFINLRIRKRALLFILTDLSDPLLAETFSRDAAIVSRRHIVMVDQIADAGDRPLFTGAIPKTEVDVQTRLAGHLQWAKLQELEKTLRHIGVHMKLLKPEQTSAELVGQYLQVKQRQLL